MNSEVHNAAVGRRITRLCHFTPARNLAHIVCDEVGVLATKHLKRNERKVFNPTDLERLDGYESHICCSIEYPNAWYFDMARAKEHLFPDWAVILIRPDYLWRKDTKFCPRNAAALHGSAVRSGLEGFNALFADSVTGSGGKTRTRSSARLDCIPTDEQAEVLVQDTIVLRDILAVAVRDATQARNETARLRIIGASTPIKFVIAPDIFDKRKLSQLLIEGKRPLEEKWNPS